jgi:protocatechuate 3,4-dioxygenase beta subunit
VYRAVSTRLGALLVALATASPPVVTAQGPAVIAGSVRDTAGRPLAGAVVAAPGTARSTTTDAAGRYRLAPLGPGFVLVEARMLGHRPARDSVTLAAGDRLLAVGPWEGRAALAEQCGYRLVEDDDTGEVELVPALHR